MIKLIHFTLFTLFVPLSALSQHLYMKAGTLTQNLGAAGEFSNFTTLSSMQFGGNSHQGNGQDGGGAIPIPFLEEVVITKNVDGASSRLMEFFIRTDAIPDIEIVSTAPRGSGRPDDIVHKVELKNALIAGFSTSTVAGCTSGCPVIAESYRLRYEAIRITTYRINFRGDYEPLPPFVYNVQTHTATF